MVSVKCKVNLCAGETVTNTSEVKSNEESEEHWKFLVKRRNRTVTASHRLEETWVVVKRLYFKIRLESLKLASFVQ